VDICPSAGISTMARVYSMARQIGGIMTDREKIEKVQYHLDQISQILQQDIPIVYLPRMGDTARADPLGWGHAFILRDYKEVLDDLYAEGQLPLRDGEILPV
jgi:hypothetical protein